MNHFQKYSRSLLSDSIHRHLLSGIGNQKTLYHTISFGLTNGDRVLISISSRRYAQAFYKSTQRGVMDRCIKESYLTTIYHMQHFVDAVDAFIEKMVGVPMKKQESDLILHDVETNFDYPWE